jgi:acetyl-CoA C-acetyltransferase
VTTVSGMLTKPGLAVWGSDADDALPLVADLADEARAATAVVDDALDHQGPATVAATTVTYDGLEPSEVIVVLDTPDDRRAVARSKAPEVVASALRDELVGTAVDVTDGHIR